jgi:hypothetical protein
MDNFDKIIKPYFIGNIRKRNNHININRNKKHEYSLLGKSITDGILTQLKEGKPKKKNIRYTSKKNNKVCTFRWKKSKL